MNQFEIYKNNIKISFAKIKYSLHQSPSQVITNDADVSQSSAGTWATATVTSSSSTLIKKLMSPSSYSSRFDRISSGQLSPIEDVYIMLICLSLISFFAALIVPVVCVKPSSSSAARRNGSKKTAEENFNSIILRKQREMSLSKELLEDDDSGGFLPNTVHQRDYLIVIE